MDTKKPFWVWVFCESDGTPSSSRVFSAVIVSFVLAWNSAYLWMTKELPPVSQLGAQGIFMTLFYGVNGVRAWSMKDQTPPSINPNQPQG